MDFAWSTPLGALVRAELIRAARHYWSIGLRLICVGWYAIALVLLTPTLAPVPTEVDAVAFDPYGRLIQTAALQTAVRAATANRFFVQLLYQQFLLIMAVTPLAVAGCLRREKEDDTFTALLCTE